ncbi:uncharacterized protein EV420DRAFT_355422 [Desarmillaria tabescens]|uniref:Uncharacterized protein n=1 Tax=Armillaria tabescens TaxID=1929756 RepID=A0AA39N5R6_ARMTA|nr:uncharacterized protein EV420DRAFT_355422 [Desarmillaria tabescens]KAK0458434.1 hypothetical protein EV420DRAFT_355422 [Desarmillaria tabescens]
MFYLMLNMSIFVIFIPPVLSLNITLLGAPVAFQNTPVLLHRTQGDPLDFILGAFLIHSNGSVMVATTIQAVEKFTADLTAIMTFNYTSPSEKDCVLTARLDESQEYFAESKPFSVMENASTTAPISTIVHGPNLPFGPGIISTSSGSGYMQPVWFSVSAIIIYRCSK